MVTVWMTIKDVGQYLQVPESRIRQLVEHHDIPHYNYHGFLRFHKDEIDEWMKNPTVKQVPISPEETDKETIMYRGSLIRSYKLSAATVLIGLTPLSRLPVFIKNALRKCESQGLGYLEREQFASLGENNFMDFLRLSCQTGLIEKRKEAKDNRRVHYYPTEYARRIDQAGNNDEIKNIIRESILNSIRHKWDIDPRDVKHAIVLLWYLLTLRSRGIEITEVHFKVHTDRPNNYFPKIRFNFTKGLRDFLFGDDAELEKGYLEQWNQIINAQNN